MANETDPGGNATIEINDWLFKVDSEAHTAIILSPAGEELRLLFAMDEDELYCAPVGWFRSALADAEDMTLNPGLGRAGWAPRDEVNNGPD